MKSDDAVLELLFLLIKNPQVTAAELEGLDFERRRFLVKELLAHFDVCVAQGYRGTAVKFLKLAREVAQAEEELQYKVARKRIRWLEAQGLGGKAIEEMTELFEQYRRSRKKRSRGAELAMELGILMDRAGRKDEALDLFRNAIQRYERLGSSVYNLAGAWFNVASVLYDLKRIKPSLRACDKAESLLDGQHKDLQTFIHLQRANGLEVAGDRKKAFAQYKMAATGYSELGNRRQESNILFRLGWLATRKFRMDASSERFFEQALDLKRETDYGTGLCLYHLHLAETARSLDLAGRASNHYRHALALAESLSNDSLSKRARFGLFVLALDEGRPLTEYMRAKAPKRPESSFARAKSGIYSDRGTDGYRVVMWRETPEPPVKDRTFLARLLIELARVHHRLGRGGFGALKKQSDAVTRWQDRAKRAGF